MTDNEINEAVAKKLGWEQCINPRDGYYLGVVIIPTLPDYCHSIEEAWEIMNYLAPQCFGVSIGYGTNPDFWQCDIQSNGWNKIYERANTAPMAICLAFLKLEDM